MFDNIEVEKHKFHEHKSPISMYDVNINWTVVSTKFPFSKKVLNISLDTKIIMKNYILVYITSKIEWIWKTFWWNQIYVFFDKKTANYWKNIMKFGITSVRLLILFAMGLQTVPAADSFVCCGRIRHLEKMKFSENS